MINKELRATGIGGSEVAAIVGLDDRRDAFSVYADKMGLLERAAPTARMKWGRRIEKVIAEAYGEETRQYVMWCDMTMSNPKRSWQVYTPDALVTAGPPGVSLIDLGGVDCKNVAFDQAPKWGDVGTDAVPDSIALQCQWYCSATNLPWWDVAALFGGNDLRVYRVHRDADIEAVLLAEAEAFWTNHVLAKNPPPIGSSATAAEYLRQRFPRNVQQLRPASETELDLVAQMKQARDEFDYAEKVKGALENAVREAIGDADGITLPGKGKITWLRNKDTVGTDWETIARVGLQEEDLQRLVPQHQIVTRNGSRVLRCAWPKQDVWIPKGLPEAV